MHQTPKAITRAVLGPTNTGKTHYAIERMLAHRTGVIGLPLRLLAREVYDRIVALRGPSVVALVTGEERIVPERTAYWVCTVEAMPQGIGAEFVAIDEIQMCADPERGHVFTDRLLNARGTQETLFLGAETVRPRIAELVGGAEFRRRERFSTLSYAGSKKISRMPPRSAIVGFSVDNVYAIAEVIRRLKGGAAVVMGALSPRTRNAQVEMYQNGDVDFLVATDAIGMGLNLDIGHVAFSGTVKFDGRRTRALMAHEMGQIAGRAGRFRTDGTFGVTGDVDPLEPELVRAIEEHRFAPIAKLHYRNSRLSFGSVPALLASLDTAPTEPGLIKAREAQDVATLKALVDMPEIYARIRNARDVRLLWDVCQIPDFRKVSLADHATLVARIFEHLLGPSGQIPADWLHKQVARIDNTAGDIDVLSKRLAFIRTWTYVSQRRDWVDVAHGWREETRAVEDRLSDALHAALTQRFVDRRTSVLLKRLKQRESLVADVNKDGEVHIDGEFVGKLEGFRFRLDPKASADEAKTLKSAGLAALAPEFVLRADRLYNAPDTEIDLTEQGGLMWGTDAVGKLVKGDEAMAPRIEVFVDEEAGADVAEKVARRLSHWLDRRLDALFEPLKAMQGDEALTGLARGVAFQLIEAMGIVPRSEVADDVKALDQDARGLLRKHGVRFGQFTIFMPALLKPAPTRLRLILTGLAEGAEMLPEAPPPGLVTIPSVPDVPATYYTRAGFRLSGERAIRIDMLERLADMIRAEDTRAGFEAKADMLSITGLTLEQFANLMQGMGYSAERGERPEQRAAEAGETAAAAETSEAQSGAAADAEAVVAAAAPVAEPETETKPETETAPDKEPAPSEESETKATEDTAPEVDVFYTFKWAAKPRRGQDNNGAGRRRKPDGARAKGKGPKGKRGDKKETPRNYKAAPPKKEKAIDPDNPFAALAALKDGK